MALTRFLRRVSGEIRIPQPYQTDGDPISVTIGTGVGRNSGWSLQRIEWDWYKTDSGDGREYGRYYIERMQVMDGNYGFGFRLHLATSDGEALYRGRVVSPWNSAATETTHAWPATTWPVVHEFAKGVVVVADGLTITGFIDNIDRSDLAIRYALYYTLLQLEPDDLIFLRSSRQ